MHRQTFRCIAIAATLMHAVSTVRAQDTAPVSVTIGYAGDAASSAYRGASQGLAEANVQGRFLGQTYTLVPVAAADGAGDAAQSYVAIVAALEGPALHRLAASVPGVPVFNVSSRDDALRSDCLPNLLHVVPSERMLKDAEAQWTRAHADAPAHAVAWNAGFEKYSASQLNHRYSDRYGEPMDDAAWAGWAAVKLLADSIARAGTTEHAPLLRFIRDDLAFDGQKGIEMNFRANGQLRQMILLERDGKVVGEAPVRGVADIEDLDSLGMAECKR